MTVEFIGLRELRLKLVEAALALPKSLHGAVEEHARGVLQAAQAVTPVAQVQGEEPPGTLRDSGHVRNGATMPGEVNVEIAFGGIAAPYAVYVHEMLEASHEPPGQAKYLEQPFNERAPGAIVKISEVVKKVVERHGR